MIYYTNYFLFRKVIFIKDVYLKKIKIFNHYITFFLIHAFVELLMIKWP